MNLKFHNKHAYITFIRGNKDKAMVIEEGSTSVLDLSKILFDMNKENEKIRYLYI